MASATLKKLHSHHRDLFEELNIIAGVRNTEDLAIAAKSPVKMVYLLFGNTLNIAEMIGLMRDSGKLPLVNIDLLSGFSRDACNIEYLERCGAAGIVSTHQELIRTARNRGMITILRTFALDSSAVDACLRATQNCQPDAVEILPAVAAPRVAARIRQIYPDLRIIAGGLVADLKEVESLMANGIDAVSVSNSSFWVA
ncbi:MAG TPA: glycerol-3-phosphate responsive antiterminator [Bryobacteraceae bacterium]|jgi:glycerol uptake operon antiterminator|nr:glycerol-3-phosphate responsive antiterminator [Bryobacteraceae bacterium]